MSFFKKLSRLLNDFFPFQRILNDTMKRLCWTYQVVKHDLIIMLLILPILTKIIISVTKNDYLFVLEFKNTIYATNEYFKSKLFFSITLFGILIGVLSVIKALYNINVLKKKTPFLQTFGIVLSFVFMIIGIFKFPIISIAKNSLDLLTHYIVLCYVSFINALNTISSLVGGTKFLIIYSLLVTLILYCLLRKRMKDIRLFERICIKTNKLIVNIVEFVILYYVCFMLYYEPTFLIQMIKSYFAYYIYSYGFIVTLLQEFFIAFYFIISFLEISMIIRSSRFHKRRKELPMLVSVIPCFSDSFITKKVKQEYKKYGSARYNHQIVEINDFYSIIKFIKPNTLKHTEIIFDFSYFKNNPEYYSIYKELHDCYGDKELIDISINLPAFNEESTICMSLENALKITYPYDVIINVIDDGSKDNTAKILIDTYNMIKVEDMSSYCVRNSIKTKNVTEIYTLPNNNKVRLIRKLNGKKHDALNVGINHTPMSCKGVLNVDADTGIEPDAVTCLALEFVVKNANAVTGIILPRHSKTHTFYEKVITNWQFLEYAASFHVCRGALNNSDTIPIISGAFGLFNVNTVTMLGGYKKTIAEDMKLTLDIQRKFGRVYYVPEALAYTVAPHTLRFLKIQRMRWYKGLRESIAQFAFLTVRHPRFTYSFFTYYLVEYISPRLIPISIFNLIITWNCSPCIKIFTIVSTLLHMFLAIVKILYAIKIEKKYRNSDEQLQYYKKVKILFFISPIMNLISVFWRNWAYFDYANKDWGTLVKKS